MQDTFVQLKCFNTAVVGWCSDQVYSCLISMCHVLQVKAFVRSAPVVEPETAPDSPKAAVNAPHDTAVLIDLP